MDSLEDWKLLVGLVATVAGGLWTAFVYFDKKRSARAEAPGQPADTRSGSGLPAGATLILLAGLALVGWSVFLGRDGSRVDARIDVDAENGVAAGGHISDSTIIINGGGPSAAPAAD